MKIVTLIIAFLAVGWGAYWQGHRIGLEGSPEFAKVQDAHNQEIERYLREEFENPTETELMCDRIMQTIEESQLYRD